MNTKYNQHGLKISLQELRDNINLNKKFWKHILSTNCYAYALGLDVKENNIKYYAYEPGIISNAKEYMIVKQEFTYSNLLQNLYSDLEFLGIEFREIKPKEQVSKEEWKIALFTSFLAFEQDVEWLRDFHFLRQHENGLWYHKQGWYKFPTKRDSNFEIITDPSKCYLKGKQFKKCYSLKLK